MKVFRKAKCPSAMIVELGARRVDSFGLRASGSTWFGYTASCLFSVRRNVNRQLCVRASSQDPKAMALHLLPLPRRLSPGLKVVLAPVTIRTPALRFGVQGECTADPELCSLGLWVYFGVSFLSMWTLLSDGCASWNRFEISPTKGPLELEYDTVRLQPTAPGAERWLACQSQIDSALALRKCCEVLLCSEAKLTKAGQKAISADLEQRLAGSLGYFALSYRDSDTTVF